MVEAEVVEGVADLVQAFDSEGGDESVGAEGVEGGGGVGGGVGRKRGIVAGM